MTERTARVSEEVKREVSDIIRNMVRDPAIPEMMSIIAADVTRDFSYAKIYYSLLDSGEAKEVDKALGRAAGFIRRELGQRIKLRRTPELRFVLDRSIERVSDISRLIADTVKIPEGETGRDADLQ